MNQVTIDDRPADEVEAEHWRQFVRENYRESEHKKPIQVFTFDYAQRMARESNYVV